MDKARDSRTLSLERLYRVVHISRRGLLGAEQVGNAAVEDPGGGDLEASGWQTVSVFQHHKVGFAIPKALG